MQEKESRRSAVAPSEQETTISFSRDGKIADVWTSDVTMMTKLDRKCKDSPEFYKCIETSKTQDGLLANKRYAIKDKTLVSFRGKKSGKTMTSERRAQLSEHMRNVGKSNSKSNNNLDTE